MCTRVLNNKDHPFSATARNMDWRTQFKNSFYGYRAGIYHGPDPSVDSNPGHQITWTSKYASIVITSEGLICDGMNEHGLVINGLWDASATYAPDSSSCAQTGSEMTLGELSGYVLDNYASVLAAMEGISAMTINFVAAPLPYSDKLLTAHLSISDTLGDSAIIELNGGKLVIYHNRDYRVMTNQPGFSKQLQLNEYWLWTWNKTNNAVPTFTIPGDLSSCSRFQRATCNINNVRTAVSTDDSLAQAFAVVSTCLTPIGTVNSRDPKGDNPNDAETNWQTVFDHRNLRYYFTNRRTLGTCFVDLKVLMQNQLSADGNAIVTLPLVTIDRAKGETEFTSVVLYGDVTSLLAAEPSTVGGK